MSPPRLGAAELAALAASLPGWRCEPDGLARSFKFADFSAAWAFMSRVALLAERQDHHPNWSNAYNQVHITLSTHDSGGVTEKDTALARAVDALTG